MFGSEFIYLINNDFYLFNLEDRFFCLSNPKKENIALNEFYRRKNNLKSNLRRWFKQIEADNFSNDSLDNLYSLVQDTLEIIDNQILSINCNENINFQVLKNKVVELDKTILEYCMHNEFLDTIKLYPSQRSIIKNLVTAYQFDIEDTLYLNSLKKYDLFRNTHSDSLICYFTANCRFESIEDFLFGNLLIVHFSFEKNYDQIIEINEYEFFAIQNNN